MPPSRSKQPTSRGRGAKPPSRSRQPTSRGRGTNTSKAKKQKTGKSWQGGVVPPDRKVTSETILSGKDFQVRMNTAVSRIGKSERFSARWRVRYHIGKRTSWDDRFCNNPDVRKLRSGKKPAVDVGVRNGANKDEEDATEKAQDRWAMHLSVHYMDQTPFEKGPNRCTTSGDNTASSTEPDFEPQPVGIAPPEYLNQGQTFVTSIFHQPKVQGPRKLWVIFIPVGTYREHVVLGCIDWRDGKKRELRMLLSHWSWGPDPELKWNFTDEEMATLCDQFPSVYDLTCVHNFKGKTRKWIEHFVRFASTMPLSTVHAATAYADRQSPGVAKPGSNVVTRVMKASWPSTMHFLSPEEIPQAHVIDDEEVLAAAGWEVTVTAPDGRGADETDDAECVCIKVPYTIFSIEVPGPITLSKSFMARPHHYFVVTTTSLEAVRGREFRSKHIRLRRHDSGYLEDHPRELNNAEPCNEWEEHQMERICLPYGEARLALMHTRYGSSFMAKREMIVRWRHSNHDPEKSPPSHSQIVQSRLHVCAASRRGWSDSLAFIQNNRMYIKLGVFHKTIGSAIYASKAGTSGTHWPHGPPSWAHGEKLPRNTVAMRIDDCNQRELVITNLTWNGHSTEMPPSSRFLTTDTNDMQWCDTFRDRPETWIARFIGIAMQNPTLSVAQATARVNFVLLDAWCEKRTDPSVRCMRAPEALFSEEFRPLAESLAYRVREQHNQTFGVLGLPDGEKDGDGDLTQAVGKKRKRLCDDDGVDEGGQSRRRRIVPALSRLQQAAGRFQQTVTDYGAMRWDSYSAAEQEKLITNFEMMAEYTEYFQGLDPTKEDISRQE